MEDLVFVLRGAATLPLRTVEFVPATVRFEKLRAPRLAVAEIPIGKEGDMLEEYDASRLRTSGSVLTSC